MKMRFPNGAGVLLCAVVLLGAGGAARATGIPVVDVAGLAEAVQQYTTLMDQLASMEKQLETAKGQLEAAKSQLDEAKKLYTSFSGISGHANMLQGAVSQLHSFLPSELQEVSGLMTGQVGSLAASMRQAKQQFDSTVLFPTQQLGRQKAQYEQKADYVFGYAAQAKTAFDGFARRRSALESLSTAGTTATTPKATLDLIAKATAENALLLNDIAQMLALDLKARMDGEVLKHNEDALRAAPGSTTADVRYQ